MVSTLGTFQNVEEIFNGIFHSPYLEFFSNVFIDFKRENKNKLFFSYALLRKNRSILLSILQTNYLYCDLFIIALPKFLKFYGMCDRHYFINLQIFTFLYIYSLYYLLKKYIFYYQERLSCCFWETKARFDLTERMSNHAQLVIFRVFYSQLLYSFILSFGEINKIWHNYWVWWETPYLQVESCWIKIITHTYYIKHTHRHEAQCNRWLNRLEKYEYHHRAK